MGACEEVEELIQDEEAQASTKERGAGKKAAAKPANLSKRGFKVVFYHGFGIWCQRLGGIASMTWWSDKLSSNRWRDDGA